MFLSACICGRPLSLSPSLHPVSQSSLAQIRRTISRSLRLRQRFPQAMSLSAMAMDAPKHDGDGLRGYEGARALSALGYPPASCNSLATLRSDTLPSTLFRCARSIVGCSVAPASCTQDVLEWLETPCCQAAAQAPFNDELWRWGERLHERSGSTHLWVHPVLMWRATDCQIYCAVLIRFVDPPFARLAMDGIHVSGFYINSWLMRMLTPHVSKCLRNLCMAELEAGISPFWRESLSHVRFTEPRWQGSKVILYLFECGLLGVIGRMQKVVHDWLNYRRLLPIHVQLICDQSHMQLHPDRPRRDARQDFMDCFRAWRRAAMAVRHARLRHCRRPLRVAPLPPLRACPL